MSAAPSAFALSPPPRSCGSMESNSGRRSVGAGSSRRNRRVCCHLIGIDPDYRIHVSDRLLEIHDGPLKEIAGTLIDRPNRIEDRPDCDRLAIRFEQFERPDTLDRTRGCGRKTPTAVTKMGHRHGLSHRDAALRQLRSEWPELNSRNRRK
jgi:hypothetical protein